MTWLEKGLSAVARAAFAGVICMCASGSFAASTLKMTFVTHAVFFSTESKQPQPLDPHVFVHDPAAQAATGPQGIKHVS